MGKLTRNGFLVAAAASLVVLTHALVGCGADTDKNTTFTGSYGGDWLVQKRSTASAVPYDLDFSGGWNVTFDIKGEMIGVLYAANGQVYAVDGDVDENGKFEGQLRAGQTTYPFSGTMSEQEVALMTDSDWARLTGGRSRSQFKAAAQKAGALNQTRQEQSPSPSPSPSASTEPEDEFRPGIAGNFSITINGAEYRGTFTGVGGQEETGG